MTTPITQEIPRDTWPEYFNDLSRLYQGSSVTVEVLDRQLGPQSAFQNLPLQGISHDPQGSQAGDILIEAGDRGTPFDVHLVHHPRTVRVVVTQPGLEADLSIESDDGPQTLVHIRQRPELPPPGTA